MQIGLVGCGNISGIYLKNSGQFGPDRIVACADIDELRARSKAAEHGIRAKSVEEMLADPEIEMILNLTIPVAHAEVSLAAIRAGKHVYVEKPLAVNRAGGLATMNAAHKEGVRVGCAPDTFMGGGLQTCRKLIDDGAIGAPVAATAFMLNHGPEHWHPSPEFYYQLGGGPMFDMGPYYLTALISLLGPVRRLTGTTRISFPERLISSEPKKGERIKVETATHVAGILEFESGAIATLVTSFDVWAADVPRIEIYGTEGTLSLPDPNTFGGPVRIRSGREPEWNDVPLTHGNTENSRGIGLADMAAAIQEGRQHRASGEMSLHVLDIMEGIHDSSASGQHYHPTTTCCLPVRMTELS